MSDQEALVKTSSITKTSLTRILNNKQTRYTLHASLILTWVLSNLIILLQKDEYNKNWLNECENDYCKTWILGYTILTITGIISLTMIYYINDNILIIYKYMILIFNIIGSFIIMFGTFNSLEYLCKTNNNNNSCNAGIIGPIFIVNVLTIFFGVDIIWEICSDKRTRC